MPFGQTWMGASAQHLVKSEPVEEGNHCLSHAPCKTTLTTGSLQYARRAALESQGRILRYASRGISYESYTWYDAFTELKNLDIDPSICPACLMRWLITYRAGHLMLLGMGIQGEKEWLNAVYEVTENRMFHVFSYRWDYERDKLNEWVEAQMKTITQEPKPDLYCKDHAMRWYRMVTFQSLVDAKEAAFKREGLLKEAMETVGMECPSDTFDLIGPHEFSEECPCCAIADYAINGVGILLVVGMALEGKQAWVSAVRNVCDELEEECAVADEDDLSVRDMLAQLLAFIAQEKSISK